MYAIVKVRGNIGVRNDVIHNLKLLNLTRVNHCVLFQETEKIKGMLKKGKDYITWGEISKETLQKLLYKRGKVYKDKKLVDFKDVYDLKKTQEISTQLLEGKVKLKDLNIKPVFRLKPPSKGYERKGVKKTFKQGGALGYRGDKINNLLIKMI
ncbi:MAG TPA: 50S ribosomal protein L30 [archaeon]|jgi:large subunit ribosomal protein L30|nr:50S ribosomal protein L30 [archaeon]HPC10348.1 50S ribosomal protein L30 [archaeon]HRT02341.1 50S ribosomal protein L30 [Candidatus Diapherotrites archaeon]